MLKPVLLTSYASTAVHGSIGKALDLAGLGSDSLRLIAVDAQGHMDVTLLAERIEQDRDAGYTPFLVVGSAGTVDTGAIDDLDGLADLCVQQGLWFHVDGALGALGMLAPSLAPRLKGMERADSLAFDFHKWAQIPYDAGFLLVRDGQLQQDAFAASSNYLARGVRGLAAGSPWPCDLGPELSRSFRALKVWMAFKVYGANAIGTVIQNTCDLANLWLRASGVRRSWSCWHRLNSISSAFDTDLLLPRPALRRRKVRRIGSTRNLSCVCRSPASSCPPPRYSRAGWPYALPL